MGFQMTEQVPDRIRYGDRDYVVWGPRLPEYFSKSVKTCHTYIARPGDAPDDRKNFANWSEIPTGSQIEFAHGESTDNFRGYVANWFVEDGFLYFGSVAGVVDFGNRIFHCTISPGAEALVADWFSGPLHLQEPRQLRIFAPQDSVPAESHTIILEVVSGRVVSTALVNWSGEYLEPVRSTLVEHQTPFPAERLRLTVKSYDGVPPEIPVFWECDRRGGTVGSAPQSDWVIADPHFSPQHLSISYEWGSFILKPFNAPVSHIRRRNYLRTPTLLQNGEKIWIGKHEIEVAVLG